jgi:hypothetical protein
MKLPSLHMNNENCEPRIRFTAQRGRQGFELILPRLHVFLAHTHPGGWVASGYCTGQRILDTKSQKLDVKKINK